MPKASHQNDTPDYSVVPKGTEACVVVLHEVWGLVEHTKDVCKRVGKLGFAAYAPNLYRGYDSILVPDNIQKAMEGVWELSLEERYDQAKVAETLEKKGVDDQVKRVTSIIYDRGFREQMLTKAIDSIEQASKKFDKVATLGFCVGGGMALKAATKTLLLASAVGFYGMPPAGDDIKKISTPILAIYASQDEIINQAAPGFVREMINAEKDLTLKTFPKTKHGFFNDTRSSVYNHPAAIASWDITRWFLGRTLR